MSVTKVLLLGCAQDGGIPQVSCRRPYQERRLYGVLMSVCLSNKVSLIVANEVSLVVLV